MKNRKNFRAAALVLVLCFVFSALAGCSKDSADAKRIAELEQENAELRAQIENLSDQLGSSRTVALKSWKLTGNAWSGNDGATVTLTAEPLVHEDGQSLSFLVCLNEQEIENIPCEWNGSAFVGSASLSAADGYWYYAIIRTADGNSEQFELSNPVDAQEEALVYLESSLNAYCTLYLENFEASDTTLTLASGLVQVHLPRLAADDRIPEVKDARLSFRMDGDEIQSQKISITADSASDVCEKMLSDISFSIPELGAESQLELWLEVDLSNGSTVYSNGGSWFLADGSLSMVVG